MYNSDKKTKAFKIMYVLYLFIYTAIIKNIFYN